MELLSQIDAALILPNEPNGSVQLNISSLKNAKIKEFAYENLAVFIKEEVEKNGSNAIQGKYKIEGDYLFFLPYFPFEKGMTYIVRTKDIDHTNGYSYQSFQIGEKQAVDQARVLSIYPSANQVPENLLRFYIYFNTPMQKGQALKYIQLVDTKGNIDRKAFMQFKQELWSPDGKRLTLLFDPGRIKRGVSTNLELGPALLEGNRYHLIISGEWEDVYGQPLSVEKTKTFVVHQAYRQSIKINEWVINEPNVNSLNPLIIHFDRIMDHALIQSMIQIKDHENNFILGRWEILEGERLIQFIPEKSWTKGTYRIEMDSRMEDVTGNNLNNLLDQKVGAKNSNLQYLMRLFTI